MSGNGGWVAPLQEDSDSIFQQMPKSSSKGHVHYGSVFKKPVVFVQETTVDLNRYMLYIDIHGYGRKG